MNLLVFIMPLVGTLLINVATYLLESGASPLCRSGPEIEMAKRKPHCAGGLSSKSSRHYIIREHLAIGELARDLLTDYGELPGYMDICCPTKKSNINNQKRHDFEYVWRFFACLACLL